MYIILLDYNIVSSKSLVYELGFYNIENSYTPIQRDIEFFFFFSFSLCIVDWINCYFLSGKPKSLYITSFYPSTGR